MKVQGPLPYPIVSIGYRPYPIVSIGYRHSHAYPPTPLFGREGKGPACPYPSLAILWAPP